MCSRESIAFMRTHKSAHHNTGVQSRACALAPYAPLSRVAQACAHSPCERTRVCGPHPWTGGRRGGRWPFVLPCALLWSRLIFCACSFGWFLRSRFCSPIPFPLPRAFVSAGTQCVGCARCGCRASGWVRFVVWVCVLWGRGASLWCGLLSGVHHCCVQVYSVVPVGSLGAGGACLGWWP